MSYPYAPRRFPQAPANRVNGKIRAREVRVIDADNQQIGIRTLTEALRMAQSLGVDLVEIAPEATPPVCRLVDYGKFRYQESKRQKKSRDAIHSQLKEIQLRPGIAEHDLETKVAHARGFLEEGMQVKVALRFRGREMRHPELGQQVVAQFLTAVAAYGRADAPPKRVERNIQVMLRPLPREQRGKTTGKGDTQAGPAMAPAPQKPQDAPASKLETPSG